MSNKPANHSPHDETLPSPAGGRGAGGEGVSLLNRAKSLRTHQTDAEQRIWRELRAHRFMGLKFKRQKPIGPYIVDFVCFEPRLVVELDGGQHVDQVAYDRKRDALLQAQGFAVLRFWNNQALGETEAVLEAIRLKVLTLTLDRSTLSSNPSPASGRGEQNTKEAK
ncbi:MAG TPA: endonuclease domain-containing protein [Nitrosomonas europaea]|mgnify:CR=1 FL=1|uniref:endonuclease domain-containing protein n=1 Tax=Nitrosomonas europaea TaxID=915 RepID=UPI002D165033|nr:endonuclease domain-containing protein [Nitrosomonas europaea]HRQ08803.1 endonuclease domain-containing protein [Nitrosomonas europaea]